MLYNSPPYGPCRRVGVVNNSTGNVPTKAAKSKKPRQRNTARRSFRPSLPRGPASPCESIVGTIFVHKQSFPRERSSAFDIN